MSAPETLHHFSLLREQAIPELASLAKLYRHEPTGAELLSIENDVENKVFGVTFRTPVEDSTGVPHILEHAVLCGSRKYPVKEPFVELLKGSLHTFLNAMTYPDKTCYPVASQNLQDFYNLIDVYLDAVFYPRITPETLKQEGWHYELERVGDPLIYKGVVFNEMKGAYSSPDRLLEKYAEASLYPDSNYGQDPGGDPTVIPDLTYEAFKAFHARHYHPSNARFFFFGNDDPAERLRLVDAFIADFEPMAPDSTITPQPRFAAPRKVVKFYQVDDVAEPSPNGSGAPAAPGAAPQNGQVAHAAPSGAEHASDDQTDRATTDLAAQRKTIVSVNWMLAEVGDPALMLALGILEYLLIGTPASPLRKTLLESGLGEDLVGGGLETELRQMKFAVGLRGARAADADAIERLVLDSLAALARDGFQPEAVEAAVNAVEFSLRENNSGSFPQGIFLMLRVLTVWLHDGDPIDALAFDAPLEGLRARLANGERVFETLIEQEFIANSHRVTVVLQPAADVNAKAEAAERARLEVVRRAMSQADLERVVAETASLKLAQETPDRAEDLATIPRLARADLEPRVRHIPTVSCQLAGVETLYHDLPTNGILYLDLGLDLHTLPVDLLPYVPIFGRALTELGTAKDDAVALSQRIDRFTGGIQPVTHATVVRGRPDASAWLLLRGKAVVERTDALLEILNDLLTTPRLDDAALFRQMVLEEKASREAGLIPVGHQVVNRRLRARFNEADWALEQMRGIDQLFFLRKLAERAEADWAGVRRDLESLRTRLVRRGALLVNATLDDASWHGPAGQNGVARKVEDFLAALPAEGAAREVWSRPAAPQTAEGLTIPAAVNYVAKAANLYALDVPPHGSSLAVARYLRMTWLWEKVRVQGGAYGGACAMDPRTGILSFMSYRDPNLVDTLDVYDRSGDYLRGLALSEEELTKAIIGAISDVDQYLLPDAKGLVALDWHLAGEDEATRQRRRDEILGTTAEDFRCFADALDQLRQHGQVAAMGSAQALATAESTLADRYGGVVMTTVM